MKKYYAYFLYQDEEYVIRFKIDGSLVYKRPNYFGFFEDKDFYVRSVDDVVCLAALGTNPTNIRNSFRYSFLLSHEDFVKYRSNGVKRWKYPAHEIIHWD